MIGLGADPGVCSTPGDRVPGVRVELRSGETSNDIDMVTDEPEFQLIEPGLPPFLVFSHPQDVRSRVGDIHDELDEVIAKQNASVTPVSLNLLGFVAHGSEFIYDFEECLRQPLTRHITPITNELEEEPRIAAICCS